MTGLHAPPATTVRAASAFGLAIIGVALVPAIAFAATFAWLRVGGRHCPAPVELRGSIAPERDLVRLEVGEGRP